MDMALESITKNEIVILDSNYFQDKGWNICFELYRRNYKYITNEVLVNNISLIIFAEEILRTRDVCFLDENREEFREFINQLNIHKNCLGNRGNYIYTNKKRTKNKLKRKVNIESWMDENSDKFENFGLYISRLHKLFERLKDKDVKKLFTEEQRENYEELLRVAISLSQDIIEKRDLKKLSYMENPLLIGSSLYTDQKIVATSMTLGIERPVLILTRDWDIPHLHRKIICYAENGDKRAVSALRNNINFHGLNLDNDTGEEYVGGFNL